MKMEFIANRLVISVFFNNRMARLVAKYTFGVYTFYYYSNGANRKWLFNSSELKVEPGTCVGGFYQIKNHTRAFSNMDFPLVPCHFKTVNDDFYFVDLTCLFQWYVGHSESMNESGFRCVAPFNRFFNLDFVDINID